MSQKTVCWVMDRATSKRRIHVWTGSDGVIGLTVEVYGQHACVVELDEDGALILRDVLGRAVTQSGTPVEVSTAS